MGSSPHHDDGIPRRFISIGLAAGLLAAALSLQGCVANGQVAADGRPATAAAPDTGGEPNAVASDALIGELVPPGLAGRTWLVPGPSGELLAGVLGSVGRLSLPGERPLAVGDGVVATVAPDAAGSRVIVRSVPSGRLVASVARPEEILSAAFVGDLLVLGGHLPGSIGRDPGLVAILLRDGSVSALIPPSDLPGWSGDVARTVAASPSGRTVVSGACSGERCAIDVVTVATGGVRRIADDLAAFPGVATDALLLVGDGESGWIAGLDLATGDRRWTREDGEFQHAYALADGSIVQAVASATGGTWRLVRLDPATGDGTALLTTDIVDGLTLWPELSNDRAAVVGRGGRFADAAQGGRVTAGVLDLTTGELAADALTIDLGR